VAEEEPEEYPGFNPLPNLSPFLLLIELAVDPAGEGGQT